MAKNSVCNLLAPDIVTLSTSRFQSGLHECGCYRFGFNGQEMDNEITGQTGTHTTAMFWEYDVRLGRRWNVDPLSRFAAGWSPYRAFFCNPIIYSDPFGLFETRKQARQHKRDKNIKGSIHYDKGEGKFVINDKVNKQSIWKPGTNVPANSIGYNSETGIMTAAYGAYKTKASDGYDPNPYNSHVLRTAHNNTLDNKFSNVGMLHVGGVYPGSTSWMHDFNTAFGTMANVGPAIAAGAIVIPVMAEVAVETVVASKEVILDFIVFSEVELALGSASKELLYYTAYLLYHSKYGPSVSSIIAALAPEGAVLNLNSNYSWEQLIKFYIELSKTQEAQDYIESEQNRHKKTGRQ